MPKPINPLSRLGDYNFCNTLMGVISLFAIPCRHLLGGNQAAHGRKESLGGGREGNAGAVEKVDHGQTFDFLAAVREEDGGFFICFLLKGGTGLADGSALM